ncbi:hypothetical protein BSPWISOXPB_476 [uncultured Gammaproteobacteria bacterium]|nr:hypothetical protein BSPWISOXPB_476 [uncultured Gammaproteobacteria bacterium]
MAIKNTSRLKCDCAYFSTPSRNPNLTTTKNSKTGITQNQEQINKLKAESQKTKPDLVNHNHQILFQTEMKLMSKTARLTCPEAPNKNHHRTNAKTALTEWFTALTLIK